jgi:hypothetical protein
MITRKGRFPHRPLPEVAGHRYRERPAARPAGVCSLCGRPLRSAQSIAIGMGPVCAAKSR